MFVLVSCIFFLATSCGALTDDQRSCADGMCGLQEGLEWLHNGAATIKPVAQEETDDGMAVHMLQTKGYKKSSQNDETGTYLMDMIMVGANETAGCTATFKVQTSKFVVQEANAKEFGYHIADLASLQKINGLAGGMKSLNVAGCCEVVVYTKLNFQGTSATYKQGTHKTVMDNIQSIKLKPGPCPMDPMWKEWEAKCPDAKRKAVQGRLQRRVQKDSRKCTLQKAEKGACRDKSKGDHHPAFCYTDKRFTKGINEAYCFKACVAMKGIATAWRWTTTTCECFFAGPRGEPGPPCACGWLTSNGYPRDGPNSKRGETKAWLKYGSRDKCAQIICDGPEAAAPPTPAPSPLAGMFAKFPKCLYPINKREGPGAMQRMQRDKRKCTVGKFSKGGCRDKTKVGNQHPGFCFTSGPFWPGINIDTCKKSCIAMKAMAVEMDYTNPKKDKLYGCKCLFPGPRREPGPPCPCGWHTNPGHPKDGPDSKRGDVGGSRVSVAKMECAPIACDAPDPVPPTPWTFEHIW